MGVEGLGQGLHLFRVLFGKVVSFAQILFQVVQLGEPVRLDPVAYQFPLPLPDSVLFVVVKEVRGFGFVFAQQNVAYVMTVDDAILRYGLSG